MASSISGPEFITLAVPSATLLLLRERASRLEVLMLKRRADLAFMGGLWAFPGGRSEEEDRQHADRYVISGGYLESIASRFLDPQGASLPPQAALQMMMTACRETLEECGVRVERAGAGGRYDFDALTYWAQWVTPSVAQRRYDTRFFALAMPPAASVVVDLSESSEHAWVDVSRAAELDASGAVRVSPPTLVVLHDLRLSFEAHGSMPQMLQAERQRPVPPLMPRTQRVGGEVVAVMPWDPLYPELDGQGLSLQRDLPAHLQRLADRGIMRYPAVVDLRA